MQIAVAYRPFARNRLQSAYLQALPRGERPLALNTAREGFVVPATPTDMKVPAMKKFALIAFAAVAAYGLAACGKSDDASEDAMADNVEMPADSAMATAAPPVADAEASSDASEATSATSAAAAQAGDAAEAAAADAAAAAEAATTDAEKKTK